MTESVAQFDADGESLQYQQALPISHGKLAMLLFMSTEVMFFTALLGAYVVLRFSNGLPWPTQSTMHVDLVKGILNTFILLGSSVTLYFAIRASNKDTAGSVRIWLVATIALAFAFLAVKGTEYNKKFEHGIYPRSNGSLIYDQAGETYLSNVVEEMRETIKLAEQSGLDAESLEKLYMVQSGVVDWTQFRVGRSADSSSRDSAIKAMAYRIKPIGANENLDKYLADESQNVGMEKQQLDRQLAEAEKSLKSVQEKIRELLPQRESGDEVIQAQFRDVSNEAERITDSISGIRKELKPVEARLAVAELAVGDGINDHLGLKLPMVIPNGKSWTNTYFLLTGFHAIHLIAGLIVMVCWVFFRLGKDRVHWLENFSIYWHFVDLVWLVIFGIVYFS